MTKKVFVSLSKVIHSFDALDDDYKVEVENIAFFLDQVKGKRFSKWQMYND